ncbi:MAG TPA: outer membrane beta-barrel protein [bacterium]|nr:outer membrane beta-barrel protein [bacterium]
MAFALLVSAYGLHADQAQPNLFLNAGATYGNFVSPVYMSGTTLAGGNVGLEWFPDPKVAFDLGYNQLSYNQLSVKKPTPIPVTDNDVTVALRLMPLTFGNTTLTLLGGVGYNTTALIKTSNQELDTRYSAFAGPGLRVIVWSHLALDAGVQYHMSTPQNAFHQSLVATFGLAVPLDGAFTLAGSAPAATPVSTPAPTAAPTAAPTPLSTPVATLPATETTEGRYVVRKGDDLWWIAAQPGVFDDARYWPLLLDSNRDQIRDPNDLTPGMVLHFKLRRFYTVAELADARNREWHTPRHGRYRF